jgi:hypothetical protein
VVRGQRLFTIYFFSSCHLVAGKVSTSSRGNPYKSPVEHFVPAILYCMYVSYRYVQYVKKVVFLLEYHSDYEPKAIEPGPVGTVRVVCYVFHFVPTLVL